MFQMMDEYFTFIVVRNPWSRLLSAYRDKFERKDPDRVSLFHRPYGTTIMRRYRPNASK